MNSLILFIKKFHQVINNYIQFLYFRCLLFLLMKPHTEDKKHANMCKAQKTCEGHFFQTGKNGPEKIEVIFFEISYGLCFSCFANKNATLHVISPNPDFDGSTEKFTFSYP